MRKQEATHSTDPFDDVLSRCETGAEAPTFFPIPVDKVDTSGSRFFRFQARPPNYLDIWRIELYGSVQSSEIATPAGERGPSSGGSGCNSGDDGSDGSNGNSDDSSDEGSDDSGA